MSTCNDSTVMMPVKIPNSRVWPSDFSKTPSTDIMPTEKLTMHKRLTNIGDSQLSPTRCNAT